LYLIIPPIVAQVNELSTSFPAFIERMTSGFSTLRNYMSEHGVLENLKDGLKSISSNLQGAASGVFQQ